MKKALGATTGVSSVIVGAGHGAAKGVYVPMVQSKGELICSARGNSNAPGHRRGRGARPARAAVSDPERRGCPRFDHLLKDRREFEFDTHPGELLHVDLASARHITI